MDFTLYHDINGLAGFGPLDSFMELVAKDMPAVLVVLIALLFLIPWRRGREQRQQAAVTATAAAAVALLIAQPISHWVDRLRPYAAHPAQAHLLIARSHDPSFPSDHATGGFAIAVGVFLFDRVAGTVLLILATLLAFARVYVGTHYPGDVLAGALLGTAVALVLARTPIRRLLAHVSQAFAALWQRLLRLPPTRARTAHPR